ncbi:hypothetical protein R6258_00900 [Halomonas sp. HP20-15]|uniref:hypothetical protein n=1 Tax=Halomonas sp. HP20-15 TaxID=3085901 RepID=UPI002982B239|nr:hypothetical protein [Halomonas sp. HP20-15]MDW5375464.1 hypothetical protein [Halomonas sp. HP20-15]
MAKKQDKIIEILLDRHGETFAHELGVELSRNTPTPLFRVLCLALLTSTPVGANQAMRACRALGKAGLTTPRKMADSRWEERVEVLNKNGYARYDEKTASQLEVLTDHLQTEYAGDLRKLRERANGDSSAARSLLKEFKGIGGVGADIFLREVQVCWEELGPFADKMALKSSAKLGLGDDAEALARHVNGDRQVYCRLVAALVRSQLAKDHKQILKDA